MFQSTPPREGRPSSTADRVRRDVSIHAPARGATMVPLTTARGSTSFQSTPPREGRRGKSDSHDLAPPVSIHAPARGATLVDGRPGPPRCFNPRPRARGDAGSPIAMTSPHPFQSTPPREGRPVIDAGQRRRGVSIHAPARGATDTWDNARIIKALFQSTPPREGRQCLPSRPCIGTWVSIHAPARGATTYSFPSLLSHRFQSTPPREGRPHIVSHPCFPIGFNPRPRARGDVLWCIFK